MDNELTYTSADGNTVFTSRFLKNRGTCCKSACLHCPFGFTLKKLGLQFREASENDAVEIETIMQESGQAPADWKPFLPGHIRFIEIKGQTCGVFLKNNLVLKHVFLRPHFQHQGLSKEMVESYFYI